MRFYWRGDYTSSFFLYPGSGVGSAPCVLRSHISPPIHGRLFDVGGRAPTVRAPTALTALPGGMLLVSLATNLLGIVDDIKKSRGM